MKKICWGKGIYLGPLVPPLKTPPLPHFALAGRSNVGKSSLINSINNRKDFAKISSRPGKTEMIQCFCFDDKVVLLDLPGYGYAKVSKKKQANWGKELGEQLLDLTHLQGVVLCLDSRRTLNDDDKTMIEWAEYHKFPLLLVMTKTDKLSRNEKNKLSLSLKEEIEASGLSLPPIILFSNQVFQERALFLKSFETWLNQCEGNGSFKK